MEKYVLNMDESRKLYERGKSRYVVNQCYKNIFHVVCGNLGLFQTGSWKVAYGYVSSVRNLLIRHCFIITDSGEVIDPTIFTHSLSDDRSDAYYIMKVFSEVEEYISAVLGEGGYPALTSTLRPYEKKAWSWAAENGFILCG